MAARKPKIPTSAEQAELQTQVEEEVGEDGDDVALIRITPSPTAYVAPIIFQQKITNKNADGGTSTSFKELTITNKQPTHVPADVASELLERFPDDIRKARASDYAE